MPTTPISITLPQELLEQIRSEVEKGSYASVSEFVRDAVRDKFEGSRNEATAVAPTNQRPSDGGQSISSVTQDGEIAPAHRVSRNKVQNSTRGSARIITSSQSPPPVVILNVGENSWITGKVERGQQLGGKLGFPTLNLDPSLLSSEVPHGVFVAEVEVADRIYQAAGHYGPRKTLDEWRPTLEFHLLDFNEHIPGHLVRFRLLKQIRETMKFDSLDQLKKQLVDDVVAVRRYFGD